MQANIKKHHWLDYFVKSSGAGPTQVHFLFSFFIAVTVFCFSGYYRSEILNTLLRVSPKWVSAGLFCYGLNYSLRAFRLRILSGRRINFLPHAIYASSLHGFMTYMIPFQVGDVSLPVILKSVHGIDLSEGSAILIRSRLLDMISLGGLMLAASTISEIDLAISLRLLWFAIGGILLIVPFLLRRMIASHWFQSQRFGRLLKPFAQAGKFNIIECLLSLGIWAAVASVFFCVARAINLPIGFGGILLVISIQLPLQIIPVQGVANTGNHEGGWIAALALLGVPLSQSAEFAVTSHIIILLYVLALGVVSLIAGRFK
ncbi:MAG: lysylphosphatidylglycerol synthase transmembrane domain-containing protein [Desulfosalsimonadaceae bacterium]